MQETKNKKDAYDKSKNDNIKHDISYRGANTKFAVLLKMKSSYEIEPCFIIILEAVIVKDNKTIVTFAFQMFIYHHITSQRACFL